MGLFSSRRRGYSLDEFVGGGEERAASALDLSSGTGGTRDWQKKLAGISHSKALPLANELALPAFSLVRGGDLFERDPRKKPARTEASLLATYTRERLRLEAHGAARAEQDAALAGVLRVLAGNPALCKRMLLAKPVRLVIVPRGRDYRELAFPRNTNPHAAGIFWNSEKEEVALLGLREELILEKPHLMVHEMAHAVHFLAFTPEERQLIERMLLPVYRSRRWVEEAVAIYAELAFGARYSEEELEQPDLYGKTRRDWDPQHVFALFSAELFRP